MLEQPNERSDFKSFIIFEQFSLYGNIIISSFVGLFQARALAEKNMRDLLAQREQAERNVIILFTLNEFLEL